MATPSFRGPVVHGIHHYYNYQEPDKNKLTPQEIAIYYRSAKKICRKCYAKLPLDAKKCRNPKCHNTDLRYKHSIENQGHHGYNPSILIDLNRYRRVMNKK